MTSSKLTVSDGLVLAGTALLIAGVASFSWRLALIVAGALVLSAGVKAANKVGS